MFVFCLFFPVCLSSVSLSSLSALSIHSTFCYSLSTRALNFASDVAFSDTLKRTLSQAYRYRLPFRSRPWSFEMISRALFNKGTQFGVKSTMEHFRIGSLSSPLENLQSFRIWSDPEASGIYTVLQREYWRERERERERVLQRILQREYHIKRCSWRCRHRFRSL